MTVHFDEHSWSRAARASADALQRSGRRTAVGAGRSRWAVVLACALLLVTVPFAVAGARSGSSGDARASATGDVLREGVKNPRRGVSTRETIIASGVRGERYGTRQSNFSAGELAGGAAIFGCRRPTRECTRHVNLAGGPAAHFSVSGPGAVPFTINPNATGLVEGLNAERVGGRTAAQLRGRRGARGPAGQQGAPGPQGQVGPTWARVRNLFDTQPVEDPEFTFPDGEEITIPTAGRLLVELTFREMGATCTDSGPATYGLYVDGAPIPESGITAPGDGVETVEPGRMYGLSEPVGGGERQIDLGVECLTGDLVDVDLQAGPGDYLGAILIGS